MSRLNDFCGDRHKISGVVGMTVPAGDPAKLFPSIAYKFSPNYIACPLNTEPLAFCRKIAEEIEALLIEDGFSGVAVRVESCCDSYDHDPER